jgi:hypothetical protein
MLAGMSSSIGIRLSWFVSVRNAERYQAYSRLLKSRLWWTAWRFENEHWFCLLRPPVSARVSSLVCDDVTSTSEKGDMNVTRSIVYGVVGPCKTESSQKPVPLHPLLTYTLSQWQNNALTRSLRTGFLPVSSTEDGDPTGNTRSCAGIFVLLRSESDFRSDSGGAHSATILGSAAKCRDRIQGDAGVPRRASPPLA